MNPQFPKNRLSILEDKDDKDSFKAYQENNKLSLRKQKIFNILLSKRKSISVELDTQKTKYNIDIKNISTNEEIKNNPELYIKTKFDIKIWFKYLFSQNLNYIKEALFLIDLFIRMQIKEIPLEKRILSRNDTELINKLCDYLHHQDLQIVHYSFSCLNNLSFFPRHIEVKIYTERNLNKILQFFKKYDFNFGPQILMLLINCNTENKQRIYFIEHGIFERLIFVMETTLDKLENKYYIYIIKLLCALSILFEEYDNYNKEQILKWFLPFLPFFKKTLTNSFVENPWANSDDYKYYLCILKLYVVSGVKKKDILLSIVKEDFSSTLIELYYKIKDNENRNILIKIFIDLLSCDDSINQYLIQSGILGLFINEINSIGYKNLELLDNIIFACSNIACGSVCQIQQFYLQGLVWKCYDIIEYLSQQYLNIQIKKIIFNAVYVLCEVITGCDPMIKVEILQFQDFKIINIFCFALKNILDKTNENILIEGIGNSIYELIKSGESDLDENNLIMFQNKMIENQFEEMIDDIIFNHKINEDIEKIWLLNKAFLKE